ncbi:MAG: DUF3696 domain-containing protein [Chloroflexi bacterium]|nr:DUF3696 domain-containing protein [Chloroflexota bacterium]
MLKKLSIDNLKIFDQVTIEPACLTVLIGPNGAGKSTLLQALALLKQSRGGERLLSGGRYVNLGETFAEFAKGGKLGRPKPLRFAIELTAKGADPFEPPRFPETAYDITYEATFDADGLLRHTANYMIGEQSLKFEATPRKYGEYTVPAAIPADGGTVTFTPSSYIGLPFRFSLDRENRPLHKSWDALRLKVDEFLRGIFLVPTTRGIENAEYEIPGPASPDLTRHEDVVNLLNERWDIQDEVSAWTWQVLGRRVRVVTTAQGRTALQARDGGAEVAMPNEGAGLRNLIWPLTQLAAAPTGSVVCIEEPEVHLHPSAQSRLCDVLARECHDKQIILTTQSEHILVALLNAVARKGMKPEDLAIYYFEPTDGAASLIRLAVNKRGQISGGLKGFFDASLDELEAYLKAVR